MSYTHYTYNSTYEHGTLSIIMALFEMKYCA